MPASMTHKTNSNITQSILTLVIYLTFFTMTATRRPRSVLKATPIPERSTMATISRYVVLTVTPALFGIRRTIATRVSRVADDDREDSTNFTLTAEGDCYALLGGILSFTSVGYAALTRISSKRFWKSLTTFEMSSLKSDTAAASETVTHFRNEAMSVPSRVTTN